MREDEELKNLSPEQEMELIAELKEYREAQKQGARSSNRAAALDYQGTIKHIHQEVSYFMLLKSSFSLFCSLTTSLSVSDVTRLHFSPEATSTTPHCPPSLTPTMPLPSLQRCCTWTLRRYLESLSSGPAPRKKVSACALSKICRDLNFSPRSEFRRHAKDPSCSVHKDDIRWPA